MPTCRSETATPTPPTRPGCVRRACAGRRDWWRGAVIYQVYPRSFQDSNGDGIGDLPGIARAAAPSRRARRRRGLDLALHDLADGRFRLRRLRLSRRRPDLRHARRFRRAGRGGPSARAEGHDRPGPLAHLRPASLVRREPDATATNPRADWYVWADAKDDGSPPNNWLSIFGGSAWEWDAGRQQYYLHNFLISQPDLNFHHPEVQDAMLDVVRFWLDRGVDGFRLDTVNFYFHDAELRDNPPLRARALERAHGAARPALQSPGPPLRQEPAGEPRLPPPLPRAARRLSGRDGGRRGGRADPRRRADGRVHGGGDRLHMCYAFDFLNTRAAGDRRHPAGDRALRGSGRGRLGLLGLLQPRRGAPCHALGRRACRPRRAS